jgi:hypothetical protein
MNSEDAVSSTVKLDVTSAPVDCVEIAAVSLEAVESPVRLGDTGAFEAGLSPDGATKPYSYTMALNGLVGVPQSTKLNPVTITRTLVTTGTQTVTLNAWNCEMKNAEAVSASTQIEVIAYQVYLPVVLKQY